MVARGYAGAGGAGNQISGVRSVVGSHLMQ
jgi:hypothetical protein